MSYFVEYGNDDYGLTGYTSGQGSISGQNPEEPVYQRTGIGFVVDEPHESKVIVTE